MTPNSQTQIVLSDVNKMIAEQKGVSIEELAVSDGSEKPAKKADSKEEIIVTDIVVPETIKVTVPEISEEVSDPVIIAKQYRSKADKLAKDAANFRRMADAIDPPKVKSGKKSVEVA
jgi:hypothetical protein